MKVRRYFASNMRSALDLVKQEQGAEVLILSNREVEGGVELVTADEVSEQEAAHLASSPAQIRRELAGDGAASSAVTDGRPAADVPRGDAAALAEPGEAQYLWTDRTAVTRMHEELRGLKGLLETQLCGLAWKDYGMQHPLRARVMRSLARLGLSPQLARQLVDGLADDLDFRTAWHHVLANLLLRLGASDRAVLEHGGRVALLGPTGVGKTTLAMKLAARYALEHGAETVAMISLDDRRLGAHEQMKAFGRLIGVAVYTAREATQLAELLTVNEHRRLVIIDTPGAAPGQPDYADTVRALRQLDAGAAIYHVAAAPTDYLACSHSLDAAVAQGVDACVLSKIDEAVTLGPAMSALAETALPLVYTSSGQRVPDDLERFDARALLAHGVELARQVTPVADALVFETAFAS